jgi:hypothetical protein
MSIAKSSFANLNSAANPSDYIRDKKSVSSYCGKRARNCGDVPRCDPRGFLVPMKGVSCGEYLTLNRGFRILRQPIECWKATFDPRELYAALYMKTKNTGL